MIVNHKYKFIFLRTRKTASTSTEIALSKFRGEGDIITRLPERDQAIRADLGYGAAQNYHVPLRHYGFQDYRRRILKRKKKRMLKHAGAASIKQYVGEEVWNSYFKFCFERNPFDKAISRYYYSNSLADSRPSISDYLATVPVKRLSDWRLYTENDTVLVDFVGRFETLDADLEKIAETLGLPSRIELPRTKNQYRENRLHYSKLLSKKDRARIELVCAKEMAAFGYSWAESDSG